MKKCFKCLVEKPLSDFYVHSRMADGHLNKCKSCTKKDVRDNRFGPNRDKVLNLDRSRAKLDHRKQLKKINSEKNRIQFPDRSSARQKLLRAVKNGKVFKWPVCAVPECNLPPEAHHPDYKSPLDVVWLCPAHHRQSHAVAYYSNLERQNAF